MYKEVWHRHAMPEFKNNVNAMHTLLRIHLYKQCFKNLPIGCKEYILHARYKINDDTKKVESSQRMTFDNLFIF